MTTKTISSAYPNGYSLLGVYHSLVITNSGSILGTGLTTVATSPSTIVDDGQIRTTSIGVTLLDGGAVRVGAGGVVYGLNAIVAYGAAATVSDAGLISSAIVRLGAFGFGYSVELDAGGAVTTTNRNASIYNGVAISGGAGSVVNDGSIGCTISQNTNPGEGVTRGLSVQLNDGGKVDNANSTASLSAGVAISGGAGRVTNLGYIGAPTQTFSVRIDGHTLTKKWASPSVVMDSGGVLTNGSATDSKALITSSVAVSGGYGEVVNYGVIQSTVYVFENSLYQEGSSIRMAAGGRVTNGSSMNTNADIRNGVAIGGGAGVVKNFAVIGDAFSPGRDKATYSVLLSDGGRVVNGSGTDSDATLTDGVRVAGVVTLINYGVIDAKPKGVAVSFGDSEDILVEESSGELNGSVRGGGGVLELAKGSGFGSLSGLGSIISGFATIRIDDGAHWKVTGAFKGAETVQVGASATLTFLGSADKAEAVIFDGGNATIQLLAAQDFAAKLSGFNASDKLDLTQIDAVTRLAFVENASDTGGILTVAEGKTAFHFSLLGQYSTNSFHWASDHHGVIVSL